MPSSDEPVLVPAPSLPPGPRSALVIATNTYADSRLRQLRSPVKDAEDLAAVLADPAIGGFTVTQLVDQLESRIRRAIAAFLKGRQPEETVLIYLSCHGIQDPRGRLLFAATDTETEYPHASAVRATELLDELDECAASRQILILDCCFSGSFSETKGGAKGELDLARQLRGHSRGREVLTASRGFEYSYEGEPLDGGDEITGSVFTTGLVEGLRTGHADTDKNGHITVEEAYEYAFSYVQRDDTPQTPQRWLFGGEGSKIVLARSAGGRAVAPAKIPGHLVSALESSSPFVRIGAVNGVAEWLTDQDPARRVAAIRALEEVAENDIRRVAEVASSHLEQVAPPAPAVTPPSPAVSVSPSSPPAKAAAIVPVASSVPKGAAFSLDNGRRVTSIALSASGALLATGASDAIARVWDVGNRHVAHVLRGHTDWVRGVAFSPDGRLLATGSDDCDVRIWDSRTGAPVHVLHGHTEWVWAVAFHPDGVLLASGSQDADVRVWDAKAGKPVHTLQGHDDFVRAVAFSPDGRLLASCDDAGEVRLWDAAAAREVRALDGFESGVLDIAFSPDGDLVASATATGPVYLSDPATGAQVRELRGHTGEVTGLSFSADGTLLATHGVDGTLRVWRTATGEPLRVFDGLESIDEGRCVAFSPAGNLLAAVPELKTVRFWR